MRRIYVGLVLIVPLVWLFPIHLQSIMVIATIYSIITIGLNILIGNLGQISLGHAAFYGIGAYASALLTTKLSFPFWISMPLSGMIAGGFGLLVGLTAIRLRLGYLAIGTAAFNIMFEVVTQQWETLTGGVGGFRGIPAPHLGPLAFDSDFKYFCLSFGVFVALFQLSKNILSSRIGYVLSAIKQNEVASNTMGINVNKFKLFFFTLSAFYGGIAGSLLAHYLKFLDPQSFSIVFSVNLLFMCSIGGSGYLWGGIVGALFITLFPEGLSFLAKMSFLPNAVRGLLNEYAYHLMIYGVILYLITAYMPQGMAKFLGGIRISQILKKEKDL